MNCKTLLFLILSTLIFSVNQQLSAQDSIWGYADIHNHQFANLAFAGQVIHGKAYSAIDHALPWCTELHGDAGINLSNLPATIMDLIGSGSIGHLVGGNPEFDGWPRHNSITHQQVYEDWLKRAHEGGLQLMVMLAVNNENLCNLESCNDMDMIDLQLTRAKDMEEYIDWKAGGKGKGWYRIVYSPKEARAAIAKGQLAVILGTEVDNLFDCYLDDERCTRENIIKGLDDLYKKGVRHVFPIHLYNNAFGGAAFYHSLIQPDVNGTWYKIATRVLGKPAVDLILGGLIRKGTTRDCSSEGYEHDCNTLGLTELGKFFIKELMKRGMIIDIDHMSALTKKDVLAIAEQFDYPMVSGHTGFLEISKGERKNESNLSAVEIERVRKLGGIIAPILHQGSTSETIAYSGPGTRVKHECGNSAQTFAQAYLYLKNKMKGGPIAFGSDFNGLAGNITPRFGAEGCSANTSPKVIYPFKSRFNQSSTKEQKIGDNTFNINEDGVPQVGMIPDFMEELEKLGLTEKDMEPMFRSAEGYVRTWEKAAHLSFDDYLEKRKFYYGNNEIQIDNRITYNLKETTVEAWVKKTATNSGIESIVSSSDESFIHLQTSTNSGTVNIVYLKDGQSINLPIIPQLEINEWNHIAIVVKSGDSRVYLNGALVGRRNKFKFEGEIAPTLIAQGLQIGRGWQGQRAFGGEISHVKIWNYARTEKQIKDFAYDFGLDQEGLIYGSPTSNPLFVEKSYNSLSIPADVTKNCKSVTIEAWVNQDDLRDGMNAIVSASDLGFVHMQISQSSNSKIAVYLDNGKEILLPTIVSLPEYGKWQHIALVAESGNTRIYLNGEQYGVADHTTFNGIRSSDQVHLGKGFSNVRLFQGQIADVRIWKNRALSGEEIKRLQYSPPNGELHSITPDYHFK